MNASRAIPVESLRRYARFVGQRNVRFAYLSSHFMNEHRLQERTVTSDTCCKSVFILIKTGKYYRNAIASVSLVLDFFRDDRSVDLRSKIYSHNPIACSNVVAVSGMDLMRPA
jgi:hypothetical protein